MLLRPEAAALAEGRSSKLRHQLQQVSAARERYARRQQYRKLSLQQRDEFRRKNEAERQQGQQLQALLEELSCKLLGGARLPGSGDSPMAAQVVQMLGGTKAEAAAAADGSGSAVIGFLAALAGRAAGLI